MVMSPHLLRRAGNLLTVWLGHPLWGGPASLSPGRSRLASAPPEPGARERALSVASGPSLDPRALPSQARPALRAHLLSPPLPPLPGASAQRENTAVASHSGVLPPLPPAARGHPIAPSPCPGMWPSGRAVACRSVVSSLQCRHIPRWGFPTSGTRCLLRVCSRRASWVSAWVRSCVVQTHKPFGPSVFISEVLSL